MLLTHPTNGNKCSASKKHRIPPRSVLGPQGRQKNLSLGINPIDNAELCYPHDNVASSHLCDECVKSNELSAGGDH